MATYNVNSTKSYMHAMEPMIVSLSEKYVEGQDDAFKFPSNIIDNDAPGGKTDGYARNLRQLLKDFEGVERELLIDYLSSDEENESSSESSDDDGFDHAMLDEVKENCQRVSKKQYGSEGQEAKDQSAQLLESLLQVLNTEHSEEGLQTSLVDILGFEEFTFISLLVQNQGKIVQQYKESQEHSMKRQSSNSSNSNSVQRSRNGTPSLLSEDQLKQQYRDNLERARNPTLQKAQGKETYAHVYQANDAGNVLSFTGKKYTLPVGSTRESYDNYEEIMIPPSTKLPPNLPTSLLPVKELDFLCQGTFKGYKTLNKMQSLVYDVGYNTNENMLVCAPTGAGKTDVALLSILHTIRQFVTESQHEDSVQVDIDYEEFKIVYVAPLKALAAEIVDKFSKKLAWLGIQVRELTGDMQLTKAEIMATQIIVTTPEKWDVVTRKSNGDTELVEKVKLLIIDEVHLLHEDRGSVIETLVARTLRQVESTQSMIRIVGLSATLPNYVDVADFLGVNRNVGMFYFDQSFRPVPLEQQLIGVRGKAGSKVAREKLDEVSFNKVVDMLSMGHQVMVFVHSRRDTVRTAQAYIQRARKEGLTGYFDATDSSKYEYFAREMGTRSQANKDMKELFQGGFGIHHAGMLRADRNLTEKMFLGGAIKVLCCTATLAWGVNLPAAAVVIKGTQVYNAKEGGFIDLGISDVLQIFGRAGRPQFESAGIGILCTTSDRLDHYVDLLLQQHAIESKLSEKLVDNLNAEIALGTVTNVDEGVQWLGYTYLNVRMKKNPFAYAIDWKQLAGDPMLVQKRRDMIIEAARKLHALQMIVFDERSTALIPKDLGRVASDFYLLNESVQIFNTMINPQVTEADVLSIISMSTEFDNIKFREEENKELKSLKESKVVCEIDPKLDTSQTKTNILLQSFISRASVKEAALGSDTNYIAQNSARICRALFLIGLNRRWGTFAREMLSICKAVDMQLWPFQHPMRQFKLPEQIIKQIEAKNPSIEMLRDMDASELGDFVHNQHMGNVLYKLIGRFPYLILDAECFPITSNVLRVHIVLDPDFAWSYEYHGNAQFFWILVESDDSSILHFEKFILNKRSLAGEHELDVMIPLTEPAPKQIVVRAVSDSWMGCEMTHTVSFQHLIKPYNETTQTKLLRLQPLPISALHDTQIENIYKPKFSYFNPMQTMVFHTLYNTDSNVFVGSPTGSGKTVVAELAMWHAFREKGAKVVYIAPMKALVRERVDDWYERICKNTSHKIVELTGDSLPDAQEVREADIIVTTPEKFDGISRNWQSRKFVQQVRLVIMDEIHLLASDRGPILEIIVSRMNYISSYTKQSIRLLGLSTAVSNAMDMAGWLKVKDGLFNYPSSIRPVPLEMYIDGFPDNLAFCPLMKTMNKPAFMAIKQHAPKKPVLIFVPSRRQTRLTALDLIHLCGMEDNPRRFNRMDEDELQPILAKVKDDTLRLSLQFGIGLHHAGLVPSDRQLSHKLFEAGKIQILVATSTLAWGVNLPAYLVVIKGTQFFDAKIEGYRDMDLTDILQMMGRAGRPAFDTSGVAMVFTKENKKNFYKHFLNVGFPVESSLHKVLDDHIGAEISSGTIGSRQEAMDFLTWTFLYRRAHHNPTYYGIEDVSPDGISKYLSGLIDGVIEDLRESKCITMSGDNIHPTPFLQISSYYYLSHKTMRYLLSHVKPSATFRECLRWLSQATEYDELSTRHGEELINTEMSQQMRYPADDLEECEFIWDPHIKAYLLLQAYMSRVEMPIADYVQDMVSVLDQSLRILQAYIDATAELGYLTTVLMMIRVMQCVKQCCWFDQSFVTTLPGVTPRDLPEGSYDEDGTNWHSAIPEEIDLKAVGAMDRQQLGQLARKLNVDRRKHDQFMKVASATPTGEFSVRQGSNNEHANASASANELSVELVHNNPSFRRDYKVYAPKFSKPQRETWFAIVCDVQNDELVAIKRVSPRRVHGKDVVSTHVEVDSEKLRGKELDVILMSDFTDIYYRTKHVFI